MVGKADFAPEEWARVVASPMVAGMAITAADPSGLWGLLQEAFASGRSLLDAQQNLSANPLAKAVAEDFTNPETRAAVRDRMQAQFQRAQPGEIKGKAVEELRSVAALVDAKAPNEAPGFKAWLQDVAQKVAKRARRVAFWALAASP